MFSNHFFVSTQLHSLYIRNLLFRDKINTKLVLSLNKLSKLRKLKKRKRRVFKIRAIGGYAYRKIYKLKYRSRVKYLRLFRRRLRNRIFTRMFSRILRSAILRKKKRKKRIRFLAYNLWRFKAKASAINNSNKHYFFVSKRFKSRRKFFIKIRRKIIRLRRKRRLLLLLKKNSRRLLQKNVIPQLRRRRNRSGFKLRRFNSKHLIRFRKLRLRSRFKLKLKRYNNVRKKAFRKFQRKLCRIRRNQTLRPVLSHKLSGVVRTKNKNKKKKFVSLLNKKKKFHRFNTYKFKFRKSRNKNKRPFFRSKTKLNRYKKRIYKKVINKFIRRFNELRRKLFKYYSKLNNLIIKRYLNRLPFPSNKQKFKLISYRWKLKGLRLRKKILHVMGLEVKKLKSKLLKLNQKMTIYSRQLIVYRKRLRKKKFYNSPSGYGIHFFNLISRARPFYTNYVTYKSHLFGKKKATFLTTYKSNKFKLKIVRFPLKRRLSQVSSKRLRYLRVKYAIKYELLSRLLSKILTKNDINVRFFNIFKFIKLFDVSFNKFYEQKQIKPILDRIRFTLIDRFKKQRLLLNDITSHVSVNIKKMINKGRLFRKRRSTYKKFISRYKRFKKKNKSFLRRRFKYLYAHHRIKKIRKYYNLSFLGLKAFLFKSQYAGLNILSNKTMYNRFNSLLADKLTNGYYAFKRSKKHKYLFHLILTYLIYLPHVFNVYSSFRTKKEQLLSFFNKIRRFRFSKKHIKLYKNILSLYSMHKYKKGKYLIMKKLKKITKFSKPIKQFNGLLKNYIYLYRKLNKKLFLRTKRKYSFTNRFLTNSTAMTFSHLVDTYNNFMLNRVSNLRTFLHLRSSTKRLNYVLYIHGTGINLYVTFTCNGNVVFSKWSGLYGFRKRLKYRKDAAYKMGKSFHEYLMYISKRKYPSKRHIWFKRLHSLFERKKRKMDSITRKRLFNKLRTYLIVSPFQYSKFNIVVSGHKKFAYFFFRSLAKQYNYDLRKLRRKLNDKRLSFRSGRRFASFNKRLNGVRFLRKRLSKFLAGFNSYLYSHINLIKKTMFKLVNEYNDTLPCSSLTNLRSTVTELSKVHNLPYLECNLPSVCSPRIKERRRSSSLPFLRSFVTKLSKVHNLPNLEVVLISPKESVSELRVTLFKLVKQYNLANLENIDVFLNTNMGFFSELSFTVSKLAKIHNLPMYNLDVFMVVKEPVSLDSTVSKLAKIHNLPYLEYEIISSTIKRRINNVNNVIDQDFVYTKIDVFFNLLYKSLISSVLNKSFSYFYNFKTGKKFDFSMEVNKKVLYSLHKLRIELLTYFAQNICSFSYVPFTVKSIVNSPTSFIKFMKKKACKFVKRRNCGLLTDEKWNSLRSCYLLVALLERLNIYSFFNNISTSFISKIRKLRPFLFKIRKKKAMHHLKSRLDNRKSKKLTARESFLKKLGKYEKQRAVIMNDLKMVYKWQCEELAKSIDVQNDLFIEKHGPAKTKTDFEKDPNNLQILEQLKFNAAKLKEAKLKEDELKRKTEKLRVKVKEDVSKDEENQNKEKKATEIDPDEQYKRIIHAKHTKYLKNRRTILNKNIEASRLKIKAEAQKNIEFLQQKLSAFDKKVSQFRYKFKKKFRRNKFKQKYKNKNRFKYNNRNRFFKYRRRRFYPYTHMFSLYCTLRIRMKRYFKVLFSLGKVKYQLSVSHGGCFTKRKYYDRKYL